MRTLDEIAQNLKRAGVKKVAVDIDGGKAWLKNGRTIIWSYAGGWEHVSMNDNSKTPTWEEMCDLKDMFWADDETVVQYHPAKSEYVNNLKHCLHLWRPIEQYNGKLPIPDSILVGLKGVEFK